MTQHRRTYRGGDEPVPGYHLVKFLGKGQFGEVWKATAPGGVEVALKLIDLSSREGLREFSGLQRIKSIKHANLCPISASWIKTDDGQVLEEVPDSAAFSLRGADSSFRGPDSAIDDLNPAEGRSRLSELVIAMGLGSRSLFDRLKECRKEGLTGIPADELLEYMRDSAKGIDHLNKPIHDLGQGMDRIIHGDIKPHNLLLVGDSVQVCDFGLARAIASLRKTATAMGTYAYAAPELIYGHPHAASDQYCLAVTYVELRTGQLPFSETNALKVAELHRDGKLDFSQLSAGERSVIRRATSPTPENRWPSCVEMVRHLDAACRAEPRRSSRGLWSLLWPWSREASPPLGSGSLMASIKPSSGTGSAKPSSGVGAAKPSSGTGSAKPASGAVQPASAVKASQAAPEERRAVRASPLSGATLAVSPISDVLKHADTKPGSATEALPQPGVKRGFTAGRLLKLMAAALAVAVVGAVLFRNTGPVQDAQRRVTDLVYAWLTDARVRSLDREYQEAVTQQKFKQALDATASRRLLKPLEPEALEERFHEVAQGWDNLFDSLCGKGELTRLHQVVTDAAGFPPRDSGKPLVDPQERLLSNVKRLQETQPVRARDLLHVALAAKLIDPSAHADSLAKIERKIVEAAFDRALQEAIFSEALEQIEARRKLEPLDTAGAAEWETRFLQHWDQTAAPLCSAGDAIDKIRELMTVAGRFPEGPNPLVRPKAHERLAQAVERSIDSNPQKALELIAVGEKTGLLAPDERTRLISTIEEMQKFDAAVDAAIKQGDYRAALENTLARREKRPYAGEAAAKRHSELFQCWLANVERLCTTETADELNVLFAEGMRMPDVEQEKLREELRSAARTKVLAAVNGPLASSPKQAMLLLNQTQKGCKFDEAELKSLQSRFQERIDAEKQAWRKRLSELCAKGDVSLLKAFYDAAAAPPTLLEPAEMETECVAAVKSVFEDLLKDGDPDKAKSLLKFARDLKKGFDSAALAAMGKRIDDLEADIDRVKKAKEQRPILAEFDKAQGQKDFDAAVKALKKFLDAWPNDAATLAARRTQLETDWEQVLRSQVMAGNAKETAKLLQEVAGFPKLKSGEAAINAAGLKGSVGRLIDALAAGEPQKARSLLEQALSNGLLDKTGERSLLDKIEHAETMLATNCQQALKDQKFPQAARLVAKLPQTAAAPLRAELEQMWSADFEKRFDQYCAANPLGDIVGLKKELGEADQLLLQPEGKPLFDLAGNLDKRIRADAQKDKKRADELLALGRNASLIGDAKSKELKALINAVPPPPTASLANVRQRIKARNWDSALQELGQLQAKNDPKLASVLLALAMIVESKKDGVIPTPEKFAEQANLGRRAGAAPLDNDEGKTLDNLGRMSLNKSLDDLSAAENWGALRKLLADANGWARDPAIKQHIQVRQVLIDLKDPKSNAADLKAALERLAGLQAVLKANNLDEAVVRDLDECNSTVPGLLARKDIDAKALPQLLGAAIPLYRNACDDDRMDRARADSFARLWQRQIELWIMQPIAPNAKEIELFDKDWRQYVERLLNKSVPIVEAWRAERKLQAAATSGEAVKTPLRDIGRLDAAFQPYAYFINAWALARSRPANWEEGAVENLGKALPAGKAPANSVLKSQGRLAEACRVAVAAANSARKRMTSKPIDQLLNPPWSAEQNLAEIIHRVLGAARAGGVAGPENDLKVNLALAAASRKEPDWPLVCGLAADLLAMPAPQLETNATAVYEACARACLKGNTPLEKQRGVLACSRLLKSLEDDQGTIGKAGQVYAELLSPALGAADEWKKEALAASQPAPGLDEFYVRFAGLLKGRRYSPWKAAWSPDDVLTEAVRLYGQAIEVLTPQRNVAAMAERLADHYLGRGETAAEQRRPNPQAVLADAKETLKLRPDYYRGHALQAQGYLVSSREQTELKKVVADLKKAIDAGKAGVEKCPPEQQGKAHFAYAKITLSCAFLECANNTQGRTLTKRLDWLREAEKHALAAAPIAGEHVQMALGNTYEDLAWLVAEKQKTNYLEAIAAFKKVLPSDNEFLPIPGNPTVPFSIGRCYFRALFEDYFSLDPHLLNLPKDDKKQAIAECEQWFRKACEWQKPKEHAEAHYYLGQIALQRAALGNDAPKWLKTAEDEYKKAMDLAQGNPYRPMYVVTWVRFPVDNRTALGKPDKELFAAARKRAKDELVNLPPCPRDFLVPAKEEIRLEGDIERLQGNWSAAEAKYSEALPKDVVQADISDFQLLIGRGKAVAVLARQENSLARCEAAFADFRRAAEVALTRGWIISAVREELLARNLYAALIDAAVQQPGADIDALLKLLIANCDETIQGCDALLAMAPRSPEANNVRQLLIDAILQKANASDDAALKKQLWQAAAGHLDILIQALPNPPQTLRDQREDLRQKLTP